MTITRPRLFFDFAVVVLFAVAAWSSLDFARLARLFPLTVGVIGTLVGVANLGLDAYRRKLKLADTSEEGDGESIEEGAADPGPASLSRLGYYVAWLLLYPALIWVFGLNWATVAFLVAFLRADARLPWRSTLAISIAMSVFVNAAMQVLELQWPTSVLSDVMPWSTGFL